MQTKTLTPKPRNAAMNGLVDFAAAGYPDCNDILPGTNSIAGYVHKLEDLAAEARGRVRSLETDLKRADAVAISNGKEVGRLRTEIQAQSDKYSETLTNLMNTADAGYQKLADTAIRTNEALKERLADAEVINGDLAEVLANTRGELDVWLGEVGNLQQQIADAKTEVANHRAALTAIAHHEHCNYYYDGAKAGEYGTGVTDGHRCAAVIARKALGEEVPS